MEFKLKPTSQNQLNKVKFSLTIYYDLDISLIVVRYPTEMKNTPLSQEKDKFNEKSPFEINKLNIRFMKRGTYL